MPVGETAVDFQRDAPRAYGDDEIDKVRTAPLPFDSVFTLPDDTGDVAQRRLHLLFQRGRLLLALLRRCPDGKITPFDAGSRLKAQRRNSRAVAFLTQLRSRRIRRLQVANTATAWTDVRHSFSMALVRHPDPP